MNNENVIKELNEFLRGIYIAIHGYERYIQHVEDQKIKDLLQQIQQDHKQHAIRIAERIQDLGGVPVEDGGMKGMMADWMMRMKGAADDPNFILKDAIRGEENGIQMSEKLVRGDLDNQSLQIVKQVLERDRKHLQQLQQHIQP
ncbi:ferritin-like domain-containing protein [Fervidibacillus halotolerans]|uniref:PA2169 family four-helix-bundle protein n=1 Tax=Fervidibacillus halotolerans TaxID=2980027 RepID=A0A9E8RXF1_9BACI|nr:PA2169 family four-helix-bundle protein [Fervidibacillus halotolerans]WAA12705.1 PA2169 family four-helix-bundle protein [Fervidibacillus halotolerans]